MQLWIKKTINNCSIHLFFNEKKEHIIRNIILYIFYFIFYYALKLIFFFCFVQLIFLDPFTSNRLIVKIRKTERWRSFQSRRAHRIQVSFLLATLQEIYIYRERVCVRDKYSKYIFFFYFFFYLQSKMCSTKIILKIEFEQQLTTNKVIKKN